MARRQLGKMTPVTGMLTVRLAHIGEVKAPFGNGIGGPGRRRKVAWFEVNAKSVDVSIDRGRRTKSACARVCVR